MTQELKRRAVLDSAGPVFMRYGYSRTTMGLIAEAAGMSRPALYLIYSSKEEIFSAVVSWLNQNLLDEIHSEIASVSSPEDKLLTACNRWSSSVFDVHEASPEAKDMDNLDFEAVRDIYRQFQEFLANILHQADITDLQESEVSGVARTLAHALRGCRLGSADKQDMIRMNHVLVTSICRALPARAHSA